MIGPFIAYLSGSILIIVSWPSFEVMFLASMIMSLRKNDWERPLGAALESAVRQKKFGAWLDFGLR